MTSHFLLRFFESVLFKLILFQFYPRFLSSFRFHRVPVQPRVRHQRGARDEAQLLLHVPPALALLHQLITQHLPRRLPVRRQQLNASLRERAERWVSLC